MADPKKLKPYEPTSYDLEFFLNLFRTLKEGGVWGVRTGQVYQIDKSVCTLTLTYPAWDADPMTMFVHHHNTYILKKLGWKCLPEVDWEKL